MTHSELVLKAEAWLKRKGFSVVLRDQFRAYTPWGEQPDAIGWRGLVSAVIECKLTRSDFLADKHKSFRQDPGKGMGDWRFFLSPPRGDHH